MAKTRAPQPAAETAAPPPANVPDELAPRLGSMVHVQPVPGRPVWNNEAGAFFAEGEATPQTVTVTTLRRLADGDLILVR